MRWEKMINVTRTTELNRQKAIAASARTALSATDNNSTTSDNTGFHLRSLPKVGKVRLFTSCRSARSEAQGP